jgi:hypothetical protein
VSILRFSFLCQQRSDTVFTALQKWQFHFLSVRYAETAASAIAGCGFLFLFKRLKIGKPLHHIAIAEPYHLVFLEHILLCAGVLAADTVKFLFIFIVKHIDVQIPHKTGRAAII